MRKFISSLLVAFLAQTSLALAGGDSAPAKILDVHILSDTRAIVHVKMLGQLLTYPFETCETVTLHLDDVPERFWARTWSSEIATKATYRRAIEFLVNAQATRQVVNIGAIGGGFQRIEGEDCAFESWGLAMLGGDVYSYHDPI